MLTIDNFLLKIDNYRVILFGFRMQATESLFDDQTVLMIFLNRTFSAQIFYPNTYYTFLRNRLTTTPSTDTFPGGNSRSYLHRPKLFQFSRLTP